MFLWLVTDVTKSLADFAVQGKETTYRGTERGKTRIFMNFMTLIRTILLEIQAFEGQEMVFTILRETGIKFCSKFCDNYDP